MHMCRTHTHTHTHTHTSSCSLTYCAFRSPAYTTSDILQIYRGEDEKTVQSILDTRDQITEISEDIRKLFFRYHSLSLSHTHTHTHITHQLIVAGFALHNGDPDRLLHGYDSFGNICGQKNSGSGGNYGLDMSDRP